MQKSILEAKFYSWGSVVGATVVVVEVVVVVSSSLQ